ncbi:SDR family NAD(P)-dependent oxidoreductase [Roseiconus lacunae]|uniref:SDR family NAD(P)-dependent oxidoreductase n=1 Tax=Roseiconus lacunae TaxID=2605694 RepID=UPI001E616802|nr:SDR family NAD(P)-dependent oxidoreductase [Roseiconus lacunae]MCD0458923.1 SDR family NAD(P)-dependent oxidoreductase [Roseiconus lacunae]
MIGFGRRWDPTGKLAVVTGASSGIGQSIAMQLVSRDCHVIAVARRQQRLDELAESYSDRFTPVVGDITSESTRQRIVDTVGSHGRSLDLLVNNAGVGAIGPFESASPERLRGVMEVNFFAVAELTRSLLPMLRRSSDAVICNVNSVLGHCAVPDKSEYCASKFALHGWSDSLRAELADQSIGVTLVSPSTTRSEFFDVLVDSGDAVSKSLGSWPPQRVARAAIKAIERRRSEVILSVGGKLLVYADRLCPPLMARVLRKRKR